VIISASRRTDIPAFYAEWFVNRIREGFCLWVNPFNPKQASVINLEPEQVDLIVFWTRYPRPIMPYLKELDGLGYRYYFHYTLTGYPRILEPNLPDLDICISTLKELADRIGRERIIWRYDPILISQATDFAYHERRFAELAREIGGCCHHVVVSFFDSYRAAAARLRKLGPEYQPLPEGKPATKLGTSCVIWPRLPLPLGCGFIPAPKAWISRFMASGLENASTTNTSPKSSGSR
jgi:hypothetical protein